MAYSEPTGAVADGAETETRLGHRGPTKPQRVCTTLQSGQEPLEVFEVGRDAMQQLVPELEIIELNKGRQMLIHT